MAAAFRIAVLMLFGLALIVSAARLDKTASFDDGSFLFEVVIGMAGGVCFVAGVIWAAVLMFSDT
jgi:hypothetical protein